MRSNKLFSWLVGLLALASLVNPAEAQRFPGRTPGFRAGFQFVNILNAISGPTASYVGPNSGNTIFPTSVLTTGQAEQTTIATVHAPGGITDFQTALAGSYVTGTYLTETPIPTSYTVDALAIGYNGNWYPITSGGATSWTVPSGANMWTDLTPLGITIPDGATYTLYIHATGANLPAFTFGNGTTLASDEGLNKNTGSTSVPKTVTDSDGLRRFRLAAVVGTFSTRTGDTVATVGDSKVAFATSTLLNSDNSSPTTHNRGAIPATIAAAGYAYVNVAVGGDQWSTALWGYSNRLQLARMATIIVDEIGINEFNNKGATTAIAPLAMKARAAVMFSGKKLIYTTIGPRTTLIANNPVFTGSEAGGILTVTAMTSGTIYPGMTLSTSGAPIITSQLTGTTGGIGTYAISVTTTVASTSITGTGANIDAAGADQTLASYSTALVTYNAGLTVNGAAPLDPFSVLQNSTTPNKWSADGLTAYSRTKDGLHDSPYSAYTLMPTQASTWGSQLAALTPGIFAQPPMDFSGTGTYAGGYLTNGTMTQTTGAPGIGVQTLVMRIKVATTQTTAISPIPNLSGNPYIKSLNITAAGAVTVVNPSSVTYATSASIRDGAEHELAIVDDGTTQTAYLDGASFGSATYGHQGTAGLGGVTLVSSSTAATAVSIREVTLWNKALYTANYTPVLFTGTESGLIALWHLATTNSAILGPVLPQPTNYLASVSAPPTAVYGAQRIVLGYNGPLFQLQRASDNVMMSVSAKAGSDYPDYTAITAYIGSSSASVATIYDQTGNSRNLTQSTLVNQPSFDPTQKYGNVVPILFDGYGRSSSGGLPQAQIAKSMSVGGLSLDAVSNSVFMTVESKVSYNSNNYLTTSDAGFSTGVEELNNITGNLNLRSGGANEADSTDGMIRAQPSTIGFTNSTTQSLIYLKEDTRAVGHTRTSTAMPLLTLGQSIAGGIPFNGMFRLFGMVVYGSTLSTNESVEVANSLNTTMAIPTTFDYTLVFSGDSITEGSGGLLLQNMPYWLGTQFTKTPETYNMAVHGTTMAAQYVQRPLAAAVYSASRSNVIFLAAGTNDLTTTSGSGAATYNNSTAPFVTYLKGLGYKVVVCTLLNRADSGATGANAAVQTERTSYNSLVTVNSAGADYVLDLTQNPTMGDTSGNVNNTTYYVDKLHPSSLGYRYLAGAPSGTYANQYTYYYALQQVLGVTP